MHNVREKFYESYSQTLRFLFLANFINNKLKTYSNKTPRQLILLNFRIKTRYRTFFNIKSRK